MKIIAEGSENCPIIKCSIGKSLLYRGVREILNTWRHADEDCRYFRKVVIVRDQA